MGNQSNTILNGIQRRFHEPENFIFLYFTLLLLSLASFAKNLPDYKDYVGGSTYPGSGSKIIFMQNVYVGAGADKVFLQSTLNDRDKYVDCYVSVVPASSDRMIAAGKELVIDGQSFSYAVSKTTYELTWNFKGSPNIKSITCNKIVDIAGNASIVSINSVIRNFSGVFKLEIAKPRSIFIDKTINPKNKGVVLFKSDLYIEPMSPISNDSPDEGFSTGPSVGSDSTYRAIYSCHIAQKQASNFYRYIPKGNRLYYEKQSFEKKAGTHYLITLKLYGSPEIESIDCYKRDKSLDLPLDLHSKPKDMEHQDAMRAIKAKNIIELGPLLLQEID